MEIMESLVPTTHKITEERERLTVKVKTKIRKKNLKCHKSTARVQNIDDITNVTHAAYAVEKTSEKWLGIKRK